MALGYSASSATVFPGVRYTGRFPNSPLGTMPAGEGTIIAGTGSQTAGGSRWGDYTSLTVDPTDDLTFWHVNQWVPTTSGAGWQIRIGSFKVSDVPTNILSNGGASVVSAGPNGVLDPAEVVTVALGVRNIGGPGTICTTAATDRHAPGKRWRDQSVCSSELRRALFGQPGSLPQFHLYR